VKIKLLYLGILVVVAVGLGFVTSVRLSPSVKCANSGSCQALPTLAVENEALGMYGNQELVPPKIDLAQDPLPSNVLGEETTSGEKHIYVDLKNQTLSAYDGDTLYMQTLVSTGKWGRTPTGEYTIWVKMRATRMSGGSGSDAYDLPNVPYVMFFYNQKVPKISGYSFHGTYWHNNFGYPMSHGCVNLRTVDAEKLYNWATPTTTSSITYTDTTNTGTKVTIY
jgi:hypothetical protein